MVYTFQKKTDEFYVQLKDASLFSSVGLPLEGPYHRVKNWNEAIDLYLDDEQQNVLLDVRNTMSDLLEDEIYEHWNLIAENSRNRFEPLIDRKVQEAYKAQRIPKKLAENKHYGIYWDIFHYVIECEYAEYLKPGVFSIKADLYLKGYFPCGWEGDFPVGRLIVF